MFQDEEVRFRHGLVLSIIEDMGGSLLLTELAKLLGTSKSTASFHVKRMEAAGLLEREVIPEDKRAYCIRPTRAGHLLRQHMDRAFEQQLLSFATTVSDADAKVIHRGLERLVACVERSGLNAPHA